MLPSPSTRCAVAAAAMSLLRAVNASPMSPSARSFF
jgi:hypothetical protein